MTTAFRRWRYFALVASLTLPHYCLAATTPTYCFQNKSTETFVLGVKLNNSPPKGLLLGFSHHCNPIEPPQQPNTETKVSFVLMHSKRQAEASPLYFDPSCKALNFKMSRQKTDKEAGHYSVFMWESNPIHLNQPTQYDFILEKQGTTHTLKCKP